MAGRIGLVVTEQAHLFYGDEDGIAAVGATVPIGRMAEPSDIADVCCFLASPLARKRLWFPPAIALVAVLHEGGYIWTAIHDRYILRADPTERLHLGEGFPHPD